MNRREFVQALTAALAVKPPWIIDRSHELVEGEILVFSGLRETCWRLKDAYPAWVDPAVGPTETLFYSYDCDLVYACCGPRDTVLRIFADGLCVYGPEAKVPVSVRFTTWGNAKAVAFDSFPLEPFGNRVPELLFEVAPAV